MLCTPVGGSHEDVGLTGRDIIFDTYGEGDQDDSRGNHPRERKAGMDSVR